VERKYIFGGFGMENKFNGIKETRIKTRNREIEILKDV